MELMETVWNIEQEILDVFHAICERNNLRYSLMYGTLLGAVRHQGFIPWDDDIDIMMPYEDYKKLLEIWKGVAPEKYIIQNTQTDPDFTQNFTKIRKNHTTFLQTEMERFKKYHKGIFIDIFPIYRVAPRKFDRVVQYAACAVNLLYSRGHTSGTGGLIGVGERILLYMPKRFQYGIRKAAERLICRWEKNETVACVAPCTISQAKVYYSEDLFDHMIPMTFQGKEYWCFKDYDKVLKIIYGDYMQLPPEEERVWKHSPIIVDFDHNYEELTGSYEQ